MRLIPTNCIKEGNYLAKTMYDTQGRVLLSAGVKLTATILRWVEQNGLVSLYINDQYSEGEIEDVIKPELRLRAVKALKDSFDDIVKYNEYKDKAVTEQQKRVAASIKFQNTNNLTKLVDDIIEQVLDQKNILINLVDIKSMDNYTYEHCVNVIILSIIIGVELKLDRKRLYDLAIGAMLHDVGKVFIPKDVLQKPGSLTSEEYDIIKTHSVKGYDYLKDDVCVSIVSRIVALQHHEKIDGSGYPDGVKGDKIHEFARIVAIADVYDALTSDRPYRRAMSPNEAIEYLMGGADRYFDFNIVCSFVKKIVPYPVGTMIRLSTGAIAIVEIITPGYPLRPVVKIISDKDKLVKEYSLNLMMNNSIVIEGIQFKVPEV